MRITHKKALGFTMVEVLLAIFLVAVSATIVVATMPVANLSRAKSNTYQKAMGIAQKELESIRGMGYANATATQLASLQLIDGVTPVSANTYTFTNVDLGSQDSPARVLPSGYGTVKIEQADIDLRRITVSVRWSSKSGDQTFTVGTLIANL